MVKKLFFILISIVLVVSCKEPEYNDLLPNVTVNFTVNMNLPQYSDLQIPGTYKESPSNIGVKGIIIYNFNNTYKAFDLACPHLAVSSCSKMEFDGSLFLKCLCDDTTFSIYDGSPQSNGASNWAREYKVQVLGGNRLQITN